MTDGPHTARPASAGLSHRVVLITGAGDGLGRATALAAAAQGATVILAGRTVKKLEKVYDDIEAAGGPQAAIHPINLAGATWADLFELVSNIETHFGRLDALIHCAAHFPGFAPLSEEKPKDWMDGLQVNLTAAYALTRHALPLLLAAPAAAVVFATDTSGTQPKAFHGSYGIAKAALEAMVGIWSLELAHHEALRFHLFNPGPLRTALRRKGYPGEDPASLPPPDTAAIRLLSLLTQPVR